MTEPNNEYDPDLEFITRILKFLAFLFGTAIVAFTTLMIVAMITDKR